MRPLNLVTSENGPNRSVVSVLVSELQGHAGHSPYLDLSG